MTQHPKRPRDFNQAAKLVVDIASGKIDDRKPTPEEQGKDPNAVRRGKLGGAKGKTVRATKLTKVRRVEIATKAAKSRWKTSVHNE
jgi:hypothetical protein